jgi:hypothetical protein
MPEILRGAKMKAGDCVKLVSWSEYYYQAPDLVGKLRGATFKHNGGDWWHIKWSNGYDDSYPQADLILVIDQESLRTLKAEILAQIESAAVPT